MTIGTSLFVIALGAILRYGVTGRLPGIDMHTAGAILMWAGSAGLATGLLLIVRNRSTGGPPPPGIR